MLEKIKKIWLKYVVGYSNPQKYWNARWKADLLAEKITGKSALADFNKIKSLMEKYSCKNILEIGCGKATLRNLPNYLGLDFSFQAKKKSDLEKFIFADFTKRIPLPDKSQDAILSRRVLLHVPYLHIERAVEEISRVTKKVVILKEIHGSKREKSEIHCFIHNLPALFKKHFDGKLEFL